MEGVRYVVPIIPGPLSDLLAWWHAAATAAAAVVEAGAVVLAVWASAAATANPKLLGWELLWGPQGCGCSTMRTCLLFTFKTGRTWGPSWHGNPPPPCKATFFARTGTCVRCDGRNASVKTCIPPPTPGLATTISGMLKEDQGYWYGCLQPRGGRLYPPLKYQARLSLTSKDEFSQQLGAEARL